MPCRAGASSTLPKPILRGLEVVGLLHDAPAIFHCKPPLNRHWELTRIAATTSSSIIVNSVGVLSASVTCSSRARDLLATLKPLYVADHQCPKYPSKVAGVRTSSTLGRSASAIAAACADERSCGSVRGCALKARGIQSFEIMTAAKLSSQPRTESFGSRFHDRVRSGPRYDGVFEVLT